MPRVPENIPTRDSTNANRPVSFHEQAVRYHNSHPDLVHDGISTPSRCQEISPHKFEGYPPIRRGLKWLIRIAISPSRSAPGSEQNVNPRREVSQLKRFVLQEGAAPCDLYVIKSSIDPE